MNKTVLAITLLYFNNIFAQNPAQNYTQEINSGGIKINMVAIPAGEILMGAAATDKLKRKNEGPKVKVIVEPFWMASTEITHDQFMAFRFEDRDISPLPDAVSRPTAQYIDLTWGMGKEGGYPANSMQPYTAISYCKWLWKKTGLFYRLPTEVEWEYAAKEGKNTIWPKSVTMANAKDYAWYKSNSKESYHKVATKKPNAFGLYDILGNLAEWTMDMYSDDYFSLLKLNPTSSFFNKRNHYRALHTARGGSFKSDIAELRPSARIGQTDQWNKRDPQIPRSKWWLTDGDYVGFRIVRPAVQPSPEEIEQFFKEALELE